MKERLRICLDISAAVHQRAGVGRYTRSLAAHLLDIDRDNDYTFFYNRYGQARPQPPLDKVPARTAPLPNKPWRALLLVSHGLHLSLDRWFPDLDIFHGTDLLSPPLRKARVIITILDLSFLRFPEYHSTLNRLNLRLMAPLMVRRAEAIIAISESTKRDAVELLGADEGKIKVIHCGIGAHFQPVMDRDALERVKRKYGIAGEFILFVGRLEPRKNIPGLVKAYGSLLGAGKIDQGLVIAGERGWLYEAIFERVKALGLEGKVLFPGFVPEEDLPALYSAARLFVYPSFYEGFGLPPLEALACGTPVVASNTSSLPEVIGEAGLMVDPADTAALAEAIRKALNDEALRKSLRAKGLERARLFSWDRAAQETLNLYREVLR